MMLSYFMAERYFAGRGWVDDLGDSYLCTGRAIDRSGETRNDESVFGGMTTLAVQTDLKSGFTLTEHDGETQRIFAAPALHFRALNGNMPSIGRSYVVRCTGVDDRGGSDNQTPDERFRQIKALQRDLSANYTEESLEEASEILSAATGFEQQTFYSHGVDENLPGGLLPSLPLPTKSLPRGFLGGPLVFPDVKFGNRRPRRPKRTQVPINLDL